MPIRITEAYTLTLAMRIMELRTRFMRDGIMNVEEYANAKVGILEEPLVYDPITLDDEGTYTIYAGYRGNTKKFFEDIDVRFSPGKTREEDFIEVAVPVVDNDDCDACKNGNCDDCPHIHSYQLYFIGRDGCISISSEMLDDDDCDCHCECEGNYDACNCGDKMQECDDNVAHDFCHCECGPEHCFVECDAENDECKMNENGRCHCKYNRCCGCKTQCTDEEE